MNNQLFAATSRKIKIVVFCFAILILTMNCLGQTKNSKKQTADKSKKSSTKTQSQIKSETKEVRFYDINGNLISEEEFAEKLEDNNLTWQEVIKAGSPILKLIVNDKIGQFPAGNLVLNDKIRESVADFPSKMLATPVTLESLKGKTIVLNFWFVGCVPCMAEIPMFNQTVSKYKDDKNIEFIALTFTASRDPHPIMNLKTFLEKTEFDFQIAIASNAALYGFAVKEYPTTIVLDENGKIIFYYSHPLADSAILLDKFLKKN